MKLADFNYNLPDDLVAQTPIDKRDNSLLLHANPITSEISDKKFADIENLLDDKCFLVVNNSKVVPARIIANKESGGKIEIFYLESISDTLFKAMVRGRIKSGSKILIDKHYIIAKSYIEDGIWIFESNTPTLDLLNKSGLIPLPPYMLRQAMPIDKDRYQTVFAKNEGSVAAPTAGLHFTKELLNRIAFRGVDIIDVTLHVGIGTFKPVKSEYINDHKMHREYYNISKESADKINNNLKSGKKLIAVGTTSLRVLESAYDIEKGKIKEGSGDTDIFIKPGYKFKVTKGLITNFHQPCSTLYILVSTFMGLDFTSKCYQHAIASNYRFFSYGDAMYIEYHI